MSKARASAFIVVFIILLISGCGYSQSDIDVLNQQVVKLENKVTRTKNQYLNELSKNALLKNKLNDMTQISYDDLLETNVIIEDWYSILTNARSMNIVGQDHKVLGTYKTIKHELIVLYESGIMVYGYPLEEGNGELYLTSGSFQYNKENSIFVLTYLNQTETYNVSFTDAGLKLTSDTENWIWLKMDMPSAIDY